MSMMRILKRKSSRGFTLFIALIMTSVILAVGLALLNIAYRQVLLASTSKNSVLAFYNADGAIECALYWDSKLAFDYTSPKSPSQITCDTSSGSSNITFITDNSSNPSYHIRKFTIPCPGNTTQGDPNNGNEGDNGLATVQVYKDSSGNTAIYADGYDSCNASDPSRTERGLKAKYGDN